ncbi:MAG: C45 family autoproteolytic acyltransferase/hydrolase [Armatimonadota bacterium]
MKSLVRIRFTLLVLLLAAVASASYADSMPSRAFVAREGKGYLERVGPQLVLHVKGTPTEMGRQYGTLLKSDIEVLLSRIEKTAEKSFNATLGYALFDAVWQRQLKYMPERYVEEMKGVAEGSGVSFERIRHANTIPELFHCSGFALFGSATKDGNLYHGRILDYGIGQGFQEHSVVVIAEPDGLAPYVNVTYAGFIGSVTGMNLNGIAFGEMGGDGQGNWDGTPMSFLMRRGLEESKTLNDAKRIFSESKRTCEYYYVLSDCNLPSAVGVAATPEKIEFIGPNEANELLNTPIKDAVVLSRGDRYKLLCERVKSGWGKLDSAACLELMRRPVAMQSCLHTVLMAPKTKELWVAHATPSGEPASEQPYVYLNVGVLMAREP